jgi:hypothetical protein
MRSPGWIAAVALTAIVGCAHPRDTTRSDVEHAEQGWSPAERARIHHASQGSREIPHAWFIHLEAPSRRQPFASTQNLARYGLFEDFDTGADGLPVGLARAGGVEPGLGTPCAACTHGRVEYRGHTLQRDGAPGTFDAAAFLRDLYRALWQTRTQPRRFARFADRVLGPDATAADRVQLAARMDRQLKLVVRPAVVAALRGTPRTRPGPGRIDALGAGLNRLDARSVGAPHGRVDAPVDHPWLWDSEGLAWLQYNGSIGGRAARDVAQAVLTSGADDAGARIDVASVTWLGERYAELRPPTWPDFLPPIDHARARWGRRLYAQHCAGCHDLGMEPSCAGEQRAVAMVPLSRIGTDPRQAVNFARRMTEEDEQGASALRLADAVGDLVGDDDCAVRWRAPAAYRARPLASVWATGPYLHNGSVPTLYQLLSPVAERPTRFWVGSRELDPVHVGFRHDRASGGSLRRTTDPGNANTGHEFADRPGAPGVIGPELIPAERLALVEYLKTL